MATARWDPFHEMDRMLGGALANAYDAAGMPMDLYKTGDHFVLNVDLPGVDPGSVDVSVEDRTLTLRAERTPRSTEDAQWLVRERPSGTFARQLTVGRGLALDRISATYADGVLTLTIPVAEDAKPRKIEVAHTASDVPVEAAPAKETITT